MIIYLNLLYFNDLMDQNCYKKNNPLNGRVICCTIIYDIICKIICEKTRIATHKDESPFRIK